MLNRLIFNGVVTSGQGNGKKYLDLPWVKSQILEKLGYIAYPGTLNIRITKEINQRKKLEGKKAIQIYPAEGYCFGAVFKATINSVDCAIIIPQVKGYPCDILEIIAPIYLRETLKLKDNDSVVVVAYF